MLEISSEAIDSHGRFKPEFTGRGENRSPAFHLQGLVPEARTLAIVLEDLTHPIFGSMTHWLAWNIPAHQEVKGGIEPGSRNVGSGIVQGLGYGWHRYRGPKPPRGSSHNYRFTIYALDAELTLSPWHRAKGLLTAAAPHILQEASIDARFE
ncbi:YbhB/YbcL family Raf kinase inhibitor-like protein [Bifidobacterium aemilianum]|uniref:YbhB/YbcL family Raf kinase inhibitor-like protein n=1 Tax=Bifidobacterium aemilianum TaxID=2493120 RepID=A0A366KB87_9BIFI|nr:YbhB/YbcL family Raf kinase inhibitor-like protein [Bifidobacterium aemilianum]